MINLTIEQLYDSALVQEGLHPNPTEMVPRIQQLLEQPWVKQAKPIRNWLQAQLSSSEKDNGKKPAWSARRVLDQVTDITICWWR